MVTSPKRTLRRRDRAIIGYSEPTQPNAERLFHADHRGAHHHAPEHRRPVDPGHAPDQRIAEVPDIGLRALAASLKEWRLTPNGTEGFRKAEVTRGGVATDELSQATLEVDKAPGLHFIGEVVDVTGWLGGYNFQWAWSSGAAAGEAATSTSEVALQGVFHLTRVKRF